MCSVPGTNIAMNRQRNEMQKLKSEKDKVKDTLETDYSCPICLEVYMKPLILKCKHIFCSKCLTSWLCHSSNTCPVCRKIVLPNDPAKCLSIEKKIEIMQKSILTPKRRETIGNIPLPVAKRKRPEKSDRPPWRY